MESRALATAIGDLTHNLPPVVIIGLAQALRGVAGGDWAAIQSRLETAVAHDASRARVSEFIAAWRMGSPTVPPASVVLALETMAQHLEQSDHVQVQLIWTGPDTHVIPLRRTDQGLLDVIHSAKRTLHIVSFAVYRIDTVTEALVLAARRGVVIHIYLETSSSSRGKIDYDTIGALGEEVSRRATIYTWPLARRPVGPNGKHGSLHAKIALADDHTLFISSANLTGYAMNLNMEIGVLIRGGVHPVRVREHLQRLLEEGVFERVSDGAE